MAKREVTGGTRYYRYSECKEKFNSGSGDIKLVDGTYVGKIEGTYGHQYKFIEGTDTVVLSKAKWLDNLMEKVSPGQSVEVVYSGCGTVQKGPHKGKDMHQFRLFMNEGEDDTSGNDVADDDEIPF